MISIIAALGDNRVIGKNNELPWSMPTDSEYFHKKVLEKDIIIGRKTFESIGSKPLSKRKNIILSDTPDFKAPEGCLVANSIDQALEMVKGAEEVMICGGQKVYEQFLPMANRLYLTYIQGSFKGDAYFPEVNMTDWEEVSREDHQSDKDNKYDYSFVVLERK